MGTASDNSAKVLQQLDRILASSYFAKSGALGRLLRFVVEVALQGKNDELKEYRLGVDVFARGASFDPRVDPIVRLQAAKLRSRLAEYYSHEGQRDPIVISVPKGGYAPIFTRSVEADPPSNSAPDIQSIAVLPFVNMSSDPENEYFSDGLTEELINILTTVPGLRVVARTSVFCFKNVVQDIREIGAKLKVQTVLEGSVRKSGNQLRVTAQLIDVTSGYHLLSRAYPRELSDVFAVQEELANSVVAEIMPHMRRGKAKSALHVTTANLSAYNLYLKGMYTLANGYNGPRESIGVFEQVLKLDPGYAPASAGLAYSYFLLAWYAAMRSREAMALGKAAAQNALKIDQNLALGHTILGAIQATFEWNWAKAEASFLRAIELQPSLALAHHLYAGSCLTPQNRMPEARIAIERALELNPLDPLTRATAIYICAAAGDFAAAQQHFQMALEINPRIPFAYRSMGWVHQIRGEFEESIASFRMACELSQRASIPLGGLGHALAQAGQCEEARALIHEIENARDRSSLALAILHLGLGDPARALDLMEQAIEDREPHWVLIPLDPRVNVLRSEPRFQNVLSRLGLQSVAVSSAGLT